MPLEQSLVRVLESYIGGEAVSLILESVGDKSETLNIKRLGEFGRPSVWLDLVAGILSLGLGYAGTEGTGPITDIKTQDMLIGLGASLTVNGIVNAVRPRVAPVTASQKQAILDEISNVLSAKGQIDAANAVKALSISETGTIQTLAPATAEYNVMPSISGYAPATAAYTY